jgi:hypothetical protein
VGIAAGCPENENFHIIFFVLSFPVERWVTDWRRESEHTLSCMHQKLFDVVLLGGTFFFNMYFCDGRSLEAYKCCTHYCTRKATYTHALKLIMPALMLKSVLFIAQSRALKPALIFCTCMYFGF